MIKVFDRVDLCWLGSDEWSQFGYKQMYFVTRRYPEFNDEYITLIYSYNTLVRYFVWSNDTMYITDIYYSRTTSKQITQCKFMIQPNTICKVNDFKNSKLVKYFGLYR